MTAGEYIAAFASIILALAVTDLATSMHHLLRARSRVRWDWLPLAVAFLILLGAVRFWWVFFETWHSSRAFNIGKFLPDFLTLLLLFFVASAALPDAVPSDGIDLEEYYFENRAYFWNLFALLAVSTSAAAIMHRWTSAAGPMDVIRWTLQSGNVELVIISGILIAVRRRWVHAVSILFMLAVLTWHWVALTIAD